MFVTVHGISRNAEEHAKLLADHAEKYGVVLLAPCFTAAHNDDYQRLGRAGRGSRADLVLDSMIEDVASSTGAVSDKVYLFGFSGGAQFVHRYTMAHPERVARAVVVAAGWYTFPDTETPYPYGIGASPDLPGLTFDPAEFLRVPIAVFVGEADLTSDNLRRNAAVDRQQGLTRLERAQRWVAAMRRAAVDYDVEPRVSYESVAGIHHSFKQFVLEGGLADRAFVWLFGPSAAAAGGD
jgi:pimeloyl-ACP methyl ester carboxylesterase